MNEKQQTRETIMRHTMLCGVGKTEEYPDRNIKIDVDGND